MTRFFSLFLILVASTCVHANEWQTRLEEDAVIVETRKIDGSKYEEFRAYTLVNVNTASALALLRDTDACSAWVFRCKESRILTEPSATERTFYQVTTLPFPAKARDVIFHAEISYKSDGSVLVAMTARPEAIDETRYVRIQEARGSYLIEPLSEKQSRVTWQQYVDPAGSLPSWLVNSMMTDLPYKSLTSFRELVATAPYAGYVMVYDADGQPIDIRVE